MKPFNLEVALNGAKVVTRDGREVKQLTLFDVSGDYPLHGVVGDDLHSFMVTGRYWADSPVFDDPLDLFMAGDE